MKKLLFSITILLASIAANAQASVDMFQMTIKSPNPAALNQVRVFIRPIINRSGQINTFQFAISVPITALPAPTATVTSLVNGLSFDTARVTIESFGGVSYRNYTFLGDGGPTVPNTAYVAATEYPIADVTFSGGPSDPQTIRACSYPDGGSNFQSYFYMALGGIPTVNRPAQFYGSNFLNGLFETGYSYVALSGVILPTKFVSFFATKSDDNAKLTWTVDNEEDNAYFEVEASTDARTFTKILKVDAQRNGRSSNTYNATDAQIGRYNVATIYYRIKQVEASGKVTYTDVRQINLDSKNFVAALYPNPVKTITKLMIEAPEAAKATVIIRDAAGKAVKQISLQLQKGTNQQNLDVTMLAAGDYNVTIVSDKLNQTIKMTKSN